MHFSIQYTFFSFCQCLYLGLSYKKWVNILLLILEKNALSFSPLSMMLVVGLLYMDFFFFFTMLGYIPSMLILLRFLGMDECWFLIHAFSASFEMTYFYLFINVACHILICINVEPCCIPGINATWWWCMIFLICCCF